VTTAPIGTVAHYNLLERLDPAGPGELYRARDTRLGRTVVVRWLPPGAGFGSLSPAALIQDAKGLAAFSHPNVTAVFDAGEHQRRIYIVSEYVTGRSLRAEMAGRAMNVRLAVELAVQVTDAVAAVHAAGYLHGGLSPDAILITAKGRAKIPAFELASRTGFTDAGGTRLVDYESPEESRGAAPDDRADVFSAGAVLYELLTMRRPSPRGASAPSASNPRVTPELDAIVLKAISPNPDHRYPSAAAFAGSLRAILANMNDSEEADARSRASAGKGRAIVIGLAVLAVVLTTLMWLF
jgi:eukaryotic-like serine/threonine-protein kinase